MLTRDTYLTWMTDRVSTAHLPLHLRPSSSDKAEMAPSHIDLWTSGSESSGVTVNLLICTDCVFLVGLLSYRTPDPDPEIHHH